MTHHSKSKSNVVRKQSRPKKLAGKVVKGARNIFEKAFHAYDKSVQGATGTTAAYEKKMAKQAQQSGE